MVNVGSVSDSASVALVKQQTQTTATAIAAPKDAATLLAPASVEDTEDAFGPAVSLDLSPPAQEIVDAAPVTVAADVPATTQSTSAPATAPAKSGGSAAGGAPVVAAEEVDISSALREVSAQVGTANAASYVDEKGNINKVALAKAVADLQSAKVSD